MPPIIIGRWDRAALRHRLLRAASLGLGLLLLLAFVTVPLQTVHQAVLTFGGIALLLVLNRSKSRNASLVLVVISVAVTSRYLFWRATDTLDFESMPQTILGIGLFGAELFAGVLMALSYVQTSWPLNRKPVPLPRDPAAWPTVDVYVPSYNEALEIVRPTVLAAMGMDWPPEKLRVWILDDGRRPEFRRFAEQVGCGYIIRPDNKGAKAGNLNHALRHTDGEFIAIFDCDHAPTRAFLQMTVGWLVRDARIAMVQTPHHFYSPDPFERNLARKRPVPNEGLLFYGVIQPGNDLWNAAFFCGSCAVIRRSALEEVGGVPHTTVTEDCHCSFLMQQRGWHTAYLRVPLASGLATERLALHIGQRMRWARGMLQIMRLENTLFARGLGPWQRLCYFIAQFGFLFALPRIIFLCSPLAFLFFGQSVIAASPLAILVYAGSHMIHAVATTARLNGPHRHSFWSEIYEASLAFPLLPVTLMTLWDPRKGKFNVTDKGGTLENGYIDLRAVLPNLILLGLLLVGLGIGVWGITTSEVGSLAHRAYLLNAAWAALCLVPVSGAIVVGCEREQMRIRARAEARIPAKLLMPSGNAISAVSSDISMSGARLCAERPAGFPDHGDLTIAFATCGEVVELRAEALQWEGGTVTCRFLLDTLADEAAVTRLFFGRPDAWLHWDDWPADSPLRSLANVVMAVVDAVFRRYRLGLVKASAPRPAATSTLLPARVTDIVPPRGRAVTPRGNAARAAILFGTLLLSSPAFAQRATAVPSSISPTSSQTAAGPAAPAADTAQEIRRTLRELGLRSPMQLRGLSDLQGVLFGLRTDQVVTEARLSVFGGASPALVAGQSQVAVTLNEQSVGTIPLDPSRQAFGPLEFELDPLYFSELNRLNFRFAGRYSAECNDPFSGLLWATISDLSTVTMKVERLPQPRDLAKLPEPFFDRRVLQGMFTLPVVLPESTGSQGLRAAAIAASWFAIQADYRGATFPVERVPPLRGHAMAVVTGPDAVPGLALPRIDGPTLALVPNPSDADGTLLVIAGRTEAETAVAATALAAGRAGLSGQWLRVSAPQLPARQPYDSPRWIRTDRPVALGSLVSQGALQAESYAPASIRIPLRTAPDIATWRNRGFPVDLRFRAPPGAIVDVGASRLDIAVSGSYLKSIPLGSGERSWPVNWIMEKLGAGDALRAGSATIPPYLLLGKDELELHFDMRPLARGDCAATPGDIRAAVEPESTVDLTRLHRHARLPNLGFFASSGFPFTRMADLSGTAAVLPDRPNTLEAGVFLDLVGQLATVTGIPATGLVVVGPAALNGVAARDLLVFGALGRQPALGALLRNAAVTVKGDNLSLALPDPLQDFRAVFLDAPGSEERTRASAALSAEGEGPGVLLASESPLQPGKSVVVLSGATPAAMAAMAAALREPEQAARVRGDLSLLVGDQVQGFRTGPRYFVGELPWHMWPQMLVDDHPERALLLLGAVGALIGMPLYWMLRRRAAARLRARTPR